MVRPRLTPTPGHTAQPSKPLWVLPPPQGTEVQFHCKRTDGESEDLAGVVETGTGTGTRTGGPTTADARRARDPAPGLGACAVASH